MPTAIAIRFPFGRYHATPWERAVNEGEVEWPPSMWRLARALLATRHQRWPELSEDRFDAILTALTSTPPVYRTPAISRGHTRHYMPDLNHTSGAVSTDLVLDPYVWVDGREPLVVRWDVELAQQERDDLAKLCALVPYLGRSESLVEIELLGETPELDRHWWQPDAGGSPGVQLLQPQPGITRADLEISTPVLRRKRLPLPPRTSLSSYSREPLEAPSPPPVEDAQISTVRWRLETKAPFGVERGILATERLRTIKLAQTERVLAFLPTSLRGKQDNLKVEDHHRHAHWLWLGDHRGRVVDLALWIPDGDLGAAAAAAMIARSEFDGSTGRNQRGFVPGRVHVVALGDPGQVLPELTGSSTTWTSRTPYLPVRHRKRNQSIDDWVSRDVSKECHYRGLPEPVEVVVLHGRQAEAVRYRRYRWSDSMAQRREAVWVSMRFGEPVVGRGPVCLGRFSHFGFGLFAPELPASPA